MKKFTVCGPASSSDVWLPALRNVGGSFVALMVMLTSVGSESMLPPAVTLNLNRSAPLAFGLGVYCTVAVQVIIRVPPSKLQFGALIEPNAPIAGFCVMLKVSGVFVP